MKKLLIIVLLFSGIARAQSPVSPVQINQNTFYYEPLTHLYWIYSGGTYLWRATLNRPDSGYYVTPYYANHHYAPISGVGYVPYTGATNDLNIGSHAFTTTNAINGAYITGSSYVVTPYNGYMASGYLYLAAIATDVGFSSDNSMKLSSTPANVQINQNSLRIKNGNAGNVDAYQNKTADFVFPITAGRTYTMPDSSGTVALTSYVNGKTPITITAGVTVTPLVISYSATKSPLYTLKRASDNSYDNNTNVIYNGSTFTLIGGDDGTGHWADSAVFTIKP